MEQPQRPPLLIFSDLDGTLLDRDTYSFAPAEGALWILRSAAVPLILATSKTLPETLAIRQALGNEHPFLVENGAAAVAPEGYFSGPGASQGCQAQDGYWVKRFGPDRDVILQILRELRERPEFQFEGFADVTNERVGEWTGLPPERAALARRRCCSEPLHWRGQEQALTAFRQELSRRGLRTVQGGRFLHVLGPFDKATAVGWLLKRYQADRGGEKLRVVALGDSPNDQDMLRAADIAVIIRSPRSDDIDLAGPEWIIRTEQEGPAGWQEAMERILPGYL